MPRIPDFFLAGNSKSGTTAIYKMLQQHPGIFLSSPKEPNHLATDLCHASSGPFAPRSRAWYLGLFEDAGEDQQCGEASACYLYSQEAASEIAALNPEARNVVVLREPVSFLESYHRQMLFDAESHAETEPDLLRAMELEPERRAGREIPDRCQVPELLFYRERVRYTHQLARFDDRFSPDQLLVLLYDDFRADNEGVLARVVDFLGLPPTPIVPVEVNRGMRLRSRTAHRLLHDVSVGRGGTVTRGTRRAVKAVLPRSARRRLLRGAYDQVTEREPTGLTPDAASRLRAELRPEVDLLADRLDRDLVALWGYDA